MNVFKPRTEQSEAWVRMYMVMIDIPSFALLSLEPQF